MQIDDLLNFFFIFIILLVFAYLGSFFLSKMPIPQGQSSSFYAPIILIYSSFFGIMDNSFLFIFVIGLFADTLYAYLRPSKARGVLNILVLFGVAFVTAQLNTFLNPISTALYANTLMPNTYAFFNNDYYAILMIFFIGLSIIFNFRGEERGGD